MLTLTSSLVLGISASPSGAAAGDLTCTTVQRTAYSPGVTFTPSQQTISITTIDAPCVSTTRPDITAGTAAFTFPGVRSCLTLDQSSSGTSSIKWNTGETSVYTYISTSQTVAGQIVVIITGAVTSGPFQGRSIAFALVSPVVNVLQCIFPPGITSRVGVGTLTIA
jgi:hypothetical protein